MPNKEVRLTKSPVTLLRARMARVAAAGLLAVGCHSPTSTQGPTSASRGTEVCGGFQPWETSPYALPYPAGTAFVVHQGNCSGFGHSGFWKYGYDFAMPIGTLVTASRGGEVLYAEGRGWDGQYSPTNLVVIGHADGTVAVYSHLTHGGALVAAGDRVNDGEPIGRSGNTGDTGGFPHLHFSVHHCARLPGLPNGDDYSCPTMPVTFRNTSPNPDGLVAGRSYAAF
jgi:murein DD-endopeptidase MepM/ murein hydrolase activator NlpD